MPVVDGGRLTLGVGHLEPVLAGRVVEDVQVVDVVHLLDPLARSHARELLEAHAVTEFVQQDSDEIVVVAVAAVETEVTEDAGEAAGLAELGVESGTDVSNFRRAGSVALRRIRVEAGALRRQGTAVPRRRSHGSRVETDAAEVAVDEPRAGRAEHGLGRGARERLEGREDADRLRTVERRAPPVGRFLERDQPLLTERRAGVATDGSDWRRIVKAAPGCVAINNNTPLPA